MTQERRSGWFAVCAVLASLPKGAAADGAVPTNAVSAAALVSDAGAGGASLVERWFYGSPVRLGVVGGVAAVGAAPERAARVWTPMGASFAVSVLGPKATIDFRARAGMWAGATDDGLRLGPWFSAAILVGYVLADHVTLGGGVDTWLLLTHRDMAFIAPMVGFVWSTP